MRFFACLFTLLCYVGVLAQPASVTVGGYVKEEGSGELLYGVVVYAPAVQKAATTNSYGFFSIEVPADSLELVFSYVGYRTLHKKILPHAKEVLTVSLTLTCHQ